MSEMIMPRLSDSMEEGTIVKWLKASGDTVELGEPLVEIETDKATVIHEPDATGVIEIVAEPGQTLAIGEVIAFIGGELPLGARRDRSSASERTAGAQTVAATGFTSTRGDAGHLNASPVARQLASLHGIDLATLRG